MAEDEIMTEKKETEEKAEKPDKKSARKNKEEKELKKLREETQAQMAALNDKYMRLAAEYDNYRKRTSLELDARYNDAKLDVLKSLLPVLDNFERAAGADCADKAYKDGVELIFRQFIEILQKNGVEEIEAAGQPFDPAFHNAVMHTEDETLGENTVAEVFQKGYKQGDRVLRPSMVKVAN